MANWFSRLSPVPSFPPYTGPHAVGTIDVEIATSELQPSSTSSRFSPSSTIALRLYYPCEKPIKPTKPVYWIQQPQRKTISAYARFLRFGSSSSDLISYFSQLLYHTTIPAHRDAPLKAASTSSGRWPVLVFSHGLGGSRNAYSYLCGSLASNGIVVLALEHRDGSGPVVYVRPTKESEAFTIDYKRMPHTPSPEVFKVRNEQLEIRLWELHLVFEFLQKIQRGDPLINLDKKPSKRPKDGDSSITPLAQFTNRLSVTEPGSIIWAGHSFGAASITLLFKSIFYHRSNPHYDNASLKDLSVDTPLIRFEPSSALLSQITPSSAAILLDIWTLPLNSELSAALKSHCMPCYAPVTDGKDINDSSQGKGPFRPTPLLAVLSATFVNWTSNFNDVKELLAPPGTSARMNPLTQPQSPAHIFYPLKSAHLGQSDFGVLFPRLTKYLARATEPEKILQLNERAILQVLRENGVKVAGDNDAEILSTQAEAVPGWVAVNANEAGEAEIKAQNALNDEMEMHGEVLGHDELEDAAEDGSIRKPDEVAV